MPTYLFLITFIIASSVSVLNADPYKKEHIDILVGYNFPPLYYTKDKTNPSNHLNGSFIQLIKQFKKNHTSYNVTFKCTPRKRITKYLQQQKAHAYAVTNKVFLDEIINENYVQSDTICIMEDHIVVLKSNKNDIRDFTDLRGKKVGVLLGNKYGPLDDLFKSGYITKIAVSKTINQLQMLQKKRVDAVICNNLSFLKFKQNCYNKGGDLKFIKKPIYKIPLCLIVRKDKTKFLKDFNLFLKTHPITNHENYSAGK